MPDSVRDQRNLASKISEHGAGFVSAMNRVVNRYFKNVKPI